MPPVARRLADEDFLAGEVVERCQLRRLRSGHDDLAHRLGCRRHREIDDLVPLGSNREAGGHDIAQPGEEIRHEASRAVGKKTTLTLRLPRFLLISSS